jgi:hypothetical protein
VSVVRFGNRDQLSGSLKSLTTEQLLWESPIFGQPTVFPLKNVLDVTLAAAPQKPSASHFATVELTNGDSLCGQLVAVSDELVELKTWYAGLMKIRRVMVSSIRIDEAKELIYQGPESLAGWIQGESDPPLWDFKDAALTTNANGVIARELPLPDEFVLTFDLDWREMLGLKVLFFSDNVKSDSPSNGYELTLQGRSASLRNCQSRRPLGRGTNGLDFKDGNKARVEIRASIKTGKVILLIDHAVVASWLDPDFAANKIGRCVGFVNLNSSATKISHITLARWDGFVEGPQGELAAQENRPFGIEEGPGEPPAAAPKAPKESRIILRNGDSLVGDVISIAEQLITIRTPLKEVRIPIGMLRNLVLKPASLERCKRENGDVRAWFADGSSVVFTLRTVGEGTLAGTNQNFGAAEFKTAAFNRLEFNIYDSDFEALRSTAGW